MHIFKKIWIYKQLLYIPTHLIYYDHYNVTLVGKMKYQITRNITVLNTKCRIIHQIRALHDDWFKYVFIWTLTTVNLFYNYNKNRLRFCFRGKVDQDRSWAKRPRVTMKCSTKLANIIRKLSLIIFIFLSVNIN